jgi:hypothetical protein
MARSVKGPDQPTIRAPIGMVTAGHVGEIEGRRGLTRIDVLSGGGAEMLGRVTPVGRALFGGDSWRDHLVGASRSVSGWKPVMKVITDALARPGKPR